MAGGEDSSCSVNTTYEFDKTSKPLPTTVRTLGDGFAERESSNNVSEVEQDFWNPQIPIAWMEYSLFDGVTPISPSLMMNADKLIPSNVTTSNAGSNSNPPQPPQSVNEKISQGALAKEVKISTNL